MTPAALGFRAHTGWAAVIAVTGPVGAPQVALRARIELYEPPLPESAEIYHAAAELALPAAEQRVREATAKARAKATAALRKLVAELRAAGQPAVATGIVLSNGRLPSELAAIPR